MKIPLTLAFDDVLLVPQYSEIDSRQEVSLETEISSRLRLKIPLVATKMDTVTGVDMAIEMGRMGGLAIMPRFDSPEIQAKKVKEVVDAGVVAAAAVGCKDGSMERAEMLVEVGATVLNVDVAHGHMKKSLEMAASLRKRFGEGITILSGIAATYQCAKDLYEAGADCVLVGVGAGSICTTRVMTGCGLPGFSSLVAVAKAAREAGKTCMPDAGIRTSGDIVKALAAGASAICGGYIFAGTKETPGELIERNGVKFKQYNGSASQGEKLRQVQKFSQDKGENYILQVEGVESIVPYKGSVREVVEQLLAGVRSGLSYNGAQNIKDLWKKAEFVRVTPAGNAESGAHDVGLV